jgi:phospholipid/cholesterol/gamma-HCH transport system substrate-binding protein
MIERSKIDIWVGFLVSLVILCLVFFAFKVVSPSLSSGETYTVSAQFTNIGNLKIGAPVRSSGVLVGRVLGIELDSQTYHARIHLSLDRKYQFSKDVSAEIFTSGILGEQYVSLSQGSDQDHLQSGEEILQTSSALVLEQVLGKFLLNSVEKGSSEP